MPYFPTWIELAVSAGVVAGAVLVFIFFNENLRMVDHGDAHVPTEQDNAKFKRSLYTFTPAMKRHSLCFVVAAAAAIAFLPREAIYGPEPAPTPVNIQAS
ncbi:MAG: hypothetical protein R3E58_17570 [Phycisphaerae bacterium]